MRQEDEKMTKKTLTYQNKLSFHIRPIGVFVNIVKQSGCDVAVSKAELTVKGNKAMQLLKLGIVPGDLITIEVSGPNESHVLAELVNVVSGGDANENSQR